jgi:hypothetical protein
MTSGAASVRAVAKHAALNSLGGGGVAERTLLIPRVLKGSAPTEIGVLRTRVYVLRYKFAILLDIEEYEYCLKVP